MKLSNFSLILVYLSLFLYVSIMDILKSLSANLTRGSTFSKYSFKQIH